MPRLPPLKIFQTALIAILSIIFFTNTAFADYEIFQNYVSTSYAESGHGGSGIGAAQKTAFSFTATSSGVIRYIQTRACGASGSLRWVAFTGDVTGTSSLNSLHAVATSSWSVLDTDCTNLATTTNEFPTAISVVPGVTVTFISETNTTGTVDTYGTDVNFPSYFFNSNWSQNPVSANFLGVGWGNAPANQNQGVYSASSTASICISLEGWWNVIGCGVSTGLAWAFYPTATIYLFEQTPTIASTTPFNYLYETGELWEVIFAGTATGTQTLTLDFASATGKTLSVGTLQSTVQGASFFTTIRNWIEIFLYLAFAFGLFRIVLGLIGWTHLGDSSSVAFGKKVYRAENITKGVYNRYKL